MRWGTVTGPSGVASSAAPPSRGQGRDSFDASGLLVRGVVIAVYVSDGDAAYPESVDPSRNHVYADVMVYSTRPALHRAILRRVACGSAGLHGGPLWRPRATSGTFSGRVLSHQSDPMDLDGDHLLIAFVDGDLSSPTMLRVVDHPRRGLGLEGLDTLGQRETLRVVDGDPMLWKHHGTFFGVDAGGDFVVDARRANTGNFPEGVESPEASAGDVRVLVRPSGEVIVSGLAADGSGESFKIALTNAGLAVSLDAGATAPTARANHLQTLYVALKAALDVYGPHVHPSAMGPTGTPVPPLVVPDWTSNIVADGLRAPEATP